MVGFFVRSPVLAGPSGESGRDGTQAAPRIGGGEILRFQRLRTSEIGPTQRIQNRRATKFVKKAAQGKSSVLPAVACRYNRLPVDVIKGDPAH